VGCLKIKTALRPTVIGWGRGRPCISSCPDGFLLNEVFFVRNKVELFVVLSFAPASVGVNLNGIIQAFTHSTPCSSMTKPFFIK
jgi:hypothetical protein